MTLACFTEYIYKFNYLEFWSQIHPADLSVFSCLAEQRQSARYEMNENTTQLFTWASSSSYITNTCSGSMAKVPFQGVDLFFSMPRRRNSKETLFNKG